MNRHTPRAARRVPRGRVAVRGAVAAAIVGASALAAVSVSSAQDVSDEPFIVFDRTHPLLPAAGAPMVQVFDSGRVVVTRGPGRTRPGRHEFELGVAELERLRALAASGVAANPPLRAEPVREIVDGREVFTVVHDAVLTSMRVRVSGSDGAQTLAGAPETVREIVVEGLADRADAPVRQVGTAELIDLERSLLDVFDRPVDGEGR